MIDGKKKQMTVAAIIYLFILRDITESDQTVLGHQSKHKIEIYSGEKLHSCQSLLQSLH